ncbi:UTRA domain-containing protein [Paraclostridium bifermentans]|nr:UTRA domain-containing protein [Paraclostridium bifermentans]
MKERNSLYNIINEVYGYKMKKAEQIIEPMILSEEESKLLKQSKNTLALKLKELRTQMEIYL